MKNSVLDGDNAKQIITFYSARTASIRGCLDSIDLVIYGDLTAISMSPFRSPDSFINQCKEANFMVEFAKHKFNENRDKWYKLGGPGLVDPIEKSISEMDVLNAKIFEAYSFINKLTKETNDLFAK